jgi:uncharacterized protein YeeX (DUF496 family)
MSTELQELICDGDINKLDEYLNCHPEISILKFIKYYHENCNIDVINYLIRRCRDDFKTDLDKKIIKACGLKKEDGLQKNGVQFNGVRLQ